MKYKFISVILGTILLLSGNVISAENNIQSEFVVKEVGESVSIMVWAEPNSKVSIEIINPSADFPPKENTKESVFKSFAYLGEIKTDNRGIGKLNFTAKEKTGTYTIRYSDNAIKSVIYEKPEKEFFALTWPSIETVFDNVINTPYISVSTLQKNSDMSENVRYVKEKTKNQPIGRKAIFFGWDDFNKMLTKDDVRNYIWWDAGALKINTLLSDFFLAYKSAGESLDFIYLDLETYLSVSDLNLSADGFKQIAEDSAYASEIRPELLKRGFEFCTDPSKGELYSLADTEHESHKKNAYIWDMVMLNRTADYLTYAVYEPAQKAYPDIALCDYDKGDLSAWYKMPSFSGAEIYEGGNAKKSGTHSSFSLYGDRLSGVSNNPPEDLSGVRFNPTPFNAFLFDINRIKASYFSDKDKKVMPWVAYDDYAGSAQATIAKTPYYAEMVFHAGMLNPDAFLFWVQEEKGGVRYEKIVQQESVLSLLLDELSAVCGKSDRTPIEIFEPSWNKHYVISGMNLGEKNIWRITPDNSVDGITKESFMTESAYPEFYISGDTISFKNGKILESHFGNNTLGYWVETAGDIFPEIETSADFHRLNAPIHLDFEEYDEETLLTAEGTYNYSVKGSLYPNTGSPTVKPEYENSENNVLSVKASNSSFHYFNFVQKLKVLGEEKREQVWEIKIKLPSVSYLASGAELFGFSSQTWNTKNPISISGNQIYAPDNGKSVAVLSGDKKLEANRWYRIKRVMEFGEESAKSHIYVYDDADILIGKLENTTVPQDGFPIADISFSTSGYSQKQVLFDDFLVYPYGLDVKLEVYDEETGIKLSKIPKQNKAAIRLSYNNASAENEDGILMHAIYENGKLCALNVLYDSGFKASASGIKIFCLDDSESNVSEEKFFLWNNKSKIIPLSENIELKRE